MHRLKTLAGTLTLASLLVAGAASAAVNTGSANFSKYVAFGDSLTAGFSSGSINRTYQVNSYPALIYRQATGMTTGFEQPLVSEPGLPGILFLQRLVPSVVIAPTPGSGQPLNLNLPRPYDNMAIPGARLHDLLTKTQSTSASDPTDLVLRKLGFTQLQQGLSLKPTFVTLWIGNNDVLGAATSGIAIGGVTLTPVEQFQADYTAVVNAISATNAKMAIANIPDVTSIPFVTTIPRVIINPATNQPLLINGAPVPLIGPDGPLKAGDFVLLTASGDLAQGRGIPVGIGNGTGQPLADTEVLSAAEAATIHDYIVAYNAIIAKAATDKGAAFVDANAILKDLATNGLRVGGISYSSAFLTGGVFSYDGVHPTPFGYAYIANRFLDAINKQFGGDIPPVDLYPYVFGPLPKRGTAASVPSLDAEDALTGFVFTQDARRSLLQSLGVPQWIVDGTKPPRKPRHPRG
jgi:lysophospholipase L1-like esterase